MIPPRPGDLGGVLAQHQREQAALAEQLQRDRAAAVRLELLAALASKDVEQRDHAAGR
ncbi:MAG: hypothetical protein IT370_09395 [Deltaproteobacteria bacterium]|nr:hypothetical protein [Deltaproteobacteria bacterium]